MDSFPEFRHMRVEMLWALCTGRLYPPGNIHGTHFCQGLSRPQGHQENVDINIKLDIKKTQKRFTHWNELTFELNRGFYSNGMENLGFIGRQISLLREQTL